MEKLIMSKTLRVTLNPASDPPVLIDPIVLGKPKLKWRREPDTMEFEFVGISGFPDSFATTKATKKKINVTDGMVPGDHEYVVAVKVGEVTYTSTATVAPTTGGRPVIRN
jgi:hypothetical protein